MIAAILRLLREVCVLPLRFYQRCVSPWTPAMCRFSPTCSQYAIDAVRTHGILRGCAYSLWRILRCQPFACGGHDPVPPRRGKGVPPRRGKGPGAGFV